MIASCQTLHRAGMQGTNDNRKTKHPGGHQHHPLNMVWKIRRGHRDGTNSSHSSKLFSSESRGYFKGSDGSHSSRGSSEKNVDPQSVRDQSTKSGGSSRSANSRHSEGSDHHSATSGSSGSSLHASKTSVRSSLAGEDKSLPRHHADKCVRFSEIHIRDYERIVGDNPSCSSGPPIALGWAHGDTRILDVDTYENSRPYRKQSVRIVLTREEREQILLHWGVSFHDIIDSIRTNIKVKNQRRQTVTNLGKVERIEEAFESATRKLKRALLLRRRTGDKVKELQEQSALASHTLASLKIAEDHALSEIRADQTPVQHEPEHDNLENLELQVSVSDFCRKSPAEAKIHRSTSNLSDEDGASVTSGFTLGNSTTASMLEVERFYRELELEMFGDTELPSMVGQTLEVPGFDIPEETRYYKDPPSVTGYPADDGSNPPMKAHLDETGEPNSHHFHMENKPNAVEHNGKYLGDENRSMLSKSLQQSHDYSSMVVNRPAPPVSGSPSSLHQHYHHGSSWYAEEDNRRHNHYPNVRLSSSLDSCEMSSHYARSAVAAVEQQYLPMFAHPPSILPPGGIPHSSMPPPFMLGPSGCIPRGNSPVPDRYSSSPRSGADGPQIKHVPPPSHLTPTHWMDGCDGPEIRRFEEPVTIIEESYEPSDVLFGGVRHRNFASPPIYDACRQPVPFHSRYPYEDDGLRGSGYLYGSG